jgi:hypothetical protein
MIMVSRFGRRGLRFALLALAVAAVVSAIVMALWNALMPDLFGLHVLSFPQALGLLVLCRILFGGLGRRGGPPGFWRPRMAERWQQMTPEEREKFRAGVWSCGWRRDPSIKEGGSAAQPPSA